ncbi:Neurotrypsin [Geodia barretti]|uniref:Neurotrypsin n=1 Tax=Geodia barretti TaxID=519541 RepID=A0AA35RZ91_GEOBA|nr:Neurotrypsin [Geodia barretti]
MLPLVAFVVFLHLEGVQVSAYKGGAPEYFLAFSKNYHVDNSNILTLTITTSESAPVSYEVSSPYGSYYVTGTVSQSSHVSINLDPSLTVTGSDVTQRSKGIRVRAADSSKTISVSGMTYEQHTADAFLALPSGPVAEEYTYIASSMLWTNRSESALPSLILIVGTLDNTLLTITPTQFVIIPDDLRAPGNPQNFVSPGESYTVTLNWLNTYQIESYLDLTGSRIVSNKPLSVFAGHQCADVPARVAACDHLYEQIPPTSTWGRFFFLVPSNSVSRTSPEWYRVVSSKLSTTVFITCYILGDSQHSFVYQNYIAQVGGFKQFHMERDNYCYMISDKPILVMQYAHGASANNGIGDPFMMMTLPTEQYVANTIINFYAYENFTSDITIVALQQDAPPGEVLLLDGVSYTSDWIQLYCSEEELCGYTLHKQVSTGFHTVRSVNNQIPIAVYVYGFEFSQGYGYPAAMELKDLGVEECVDGGIRLVGGESETEGRAEVCQGGVWGTICNDNWSTEDTEVVCGQLLLLSSGITSSFYGEGEGPIHMDNVQCLGVESSILECVYDIHTADCSHSQDVGVLCYSYPAPEVELQQSPSNSQYFASYDLTLTCIISVSSNVIGRVRLTAGWSKDGIQYISNSWDSRTSATPVTQISNYVYTTNLKFLPLEERDSGTYQCTAVLTSFTGVPLVNGTNDTSLMVKELQSERIQLQLFGAENCVQWIQSKGADVKQALAGSVGDGVEDLCNCEFSARNLKGIVLQCYSDYPAKIFVLLTIQVTATKSLPDILNFITDWIARDPHIVLGESNTTVYIDKLCDITILGSECVPTSSSSSSAEIPLQQSYYCCFKVTNRRPESRNRCTSSFHCGNSSNADGCGVGGVYQVSLVNDML